MKILKLISPTPELSILRVLVKLKEKDSQFGEVVMIGENEQTATANPHVRDLRLQVGDKVAFGKYAGSDLCIPGDGCYFVMRMSDIYATVEY